MTIFELNSQLKGNVFKETNCAVHREPEMWPQEAIYAVQDTFV